MPIGPWFALVGAETKGEFLRGFFLTHNQQRFLSPMEGHHGPIYYHLISLLVGFAPWTLLLLLALGPAVRARRDPAVRFALLSFAIPLLVIILSRSRLPRYVLPVYPGAALLAAWWVAAHGAVRTIVTRVLGWAVFTGMAVTIALLPFLRHFSQLALVLPIAALFGGGVVPLVDSATVEIAGQSYARTRLFEGIVHAS